MVTELLDGADLETVTMKMICKQVLMTENSELTLDCFMFFAKGSAACCVIILVKEYRSVTSSKNLFLELLNFDHVI